MCVCVDTLFQLKPPARHFSHLSKFQEATLKGYSFREKEEEFVATNLEINGPFDRTSLPQRRNMEKVFKRRGGQKEEMEYSTI